MRHSSYEFLPRHVHNNSFAALLLAGQYTEVGDTGRHRAEPGDVLLHRAYENHLDRFDRRGADVWVLPLGLRWVGQPRGRLADPEAIVRLAMSDPTEAVTELRRCMEPMQPVLADWPDLLASSLREDPCIRISEWARQHRLSLGSVSRGFGQVYGISPVAYRLVQRTHRAIDALLRTNHSLSTIALLCGFTDQPHMTRAVRRATSMSPLVLRCSIGLS